MQTVSRQSQMFEPIQTRTTRMAWSLPASVVAHGLLALAALLLVPRPLAPPEQRTIAVDIISPEQYAALLPPEPVAEPIVVAEPPAEPAETQQSENGMVQAHDFYAADVLSDPANEEVRANFPLLAGSEQVVQLCNIEALEQLRSSGAASDPDVLVGYAFAGFAVDQDELRVEGGAFRSGGQWFHIRYRCTVMADMSGVRAFEYAVGDAVPPEQWEEHFLNADDDWLN